MDVQTTLDGQTTLNFGESLSNEKKRIEIRKLFVVRSRPCIKCLVPGKNLTLEHWSMDLDSALYSA